MSRCDLHTVVFAQSRFPGEPLRTACTSAFALYFRVVLRWLLRPFGHWYPCQTQLTRRFDIGWVGAWLGCLGLGSVGCLGLGLKFVSLGGAEVGAWFGCLGLGPFSQFASPWWRFGRALALSLGPWLGCLGSGSKRVLSLGGALVGPWLCFWAWAGSLGLQFEIRVVLGGASVGPWIGRLGLGAVAWTSVGNSVSLGGAVAGPCCLALARSLGPRFGIRFPRRRAGRALARSVSFGLRFVIWFALGGASVGPWVGCLGLCLGRWRPVLQYGLPLVVRWSGYVLVAWAAAWPFGPRFEFRFSLVARRSGFGLVAWASAWNSVSLGGALAGLWFGRLGLGPVAWASVWNSFFPRRCVGRALGWLVLFGRRFVIWFALGGASVGPLVGGLGLRLVAGAPICNSACPWRCVGRAWFWLLGPWLGRLGFGSNFVFLWWRVGLALVWLLGLRLEIRFPLAARWPGLGSGAWALARSLGRRFGIRFFLGGALAGPWVGWFRLGFGL